jgi:UDP-glucose 4-epimerase
MPNKVLVTGGAGFIGSNIAQRLVAQGREVLVLDNLSTGWESNVPAGAKFIKGSIDNYDLLYQILEGVSVVYHLAASASVVRAVEQPVFDLDNNVKGTVTLLSAMRDRGVKKILFPSSSTVYGVNRLPNQEDLKLNPVSPYAVGKIADEYYLKSFCNMYGIQSIIFRIFNAFGPGQDFISNQGITGYIIGCLLQGEEFVVHAQGGQSRDYIYIDEVVEAFIRAESNEQAIGQVMNLAGGQSISLNNWIELIEKAAGKKLKKTISSSIRQGDVMHYQADISRLQEILGFKPRVDYENQLKNTIYWARGVISGRGQVVK